MLVAGSLLQSSMDFLPPVMLLAAEVKAPDLTGASCGCDVPGLWKE